MNNPLNHSNITLHYLKLCQIHSQKYFRIKIAFLQEKVVNTKKLRTMRVFYLPIIYYLDASVDTLVIEVYDAVKGYLLYRINSFELLYNKVMKKAKLAASELIPYESNKAIFLYNNAIFNIKLEE